MRDPQAESEALEWGSDFGNPIALLNREPGELGGAAGLEFVPGHDDLDTVLVAAVRAPSGRDYTLVRHVNSPFPGTEVLTRVPLAEATTIAGDLRDLLHALGLSRDAIAWVAPAVVAAQRKTGQAAVPNARSERRHRRSAVPRGQRAGSKDRARASLKRRA